jgi:hypothetical protein
LVAEALLEGFLYSITTFWWVYLAFAGLFVLAAAVNALERNARQRRRQGRRLRR